MNFVALDAKSIIFDCKHLVPWMLNSAQTSLNRYLFNFLGENRRTVQQMYVWQEWLNCYQTVILLSFIKLFMTLLSKNCIFKYFYRWESSHRPANVRLARMADIPGLYPSKKCWGGKNIRYGFRPIQNATAPCHQIWIWRLESLGWYPCYCTLKSKNQFF